MASFGPSLCRLKGLLDLSIGSDNLKSLPDCMSDTALVKFVISGSSMESKDLAVFCGSKHLVDIEVSQIKDLCSFFFFCGIKCRYRPEIDVVRFSVWSRSPNFTSSLCFFLSDQNLFQSQKADLLLGRISRYL